MNIDENTKVIGRFHRALSPRGLNIYNPFFQEAGINALYILFHDENPEVLVRGMRSLKLAGAITAGFESDARLSALLDDMDPVAKYIGKVGFITNKGGSLKGYLQLGEGMLRTILHVQDITNKKLVIVGAGNGAKGLLRVMTSQKHTPGNIEVYNRTVENAEVIAKDFPIVSQVGSLADLPKASGDILVNLSDIGGREKDSVYTDQIIDQFGSVVDVTFETEHTNLMTIAKKLKKRFATGWDVFTYQGQVVLETMLQTSISAELLKKHVVKGLSQTVK